MCESNTFTDSGFCVEGVASWTFTLEAAKGVDALSSLAQARQLLALIDVCQREKRKHLWALWVGVICVSICKCTQEQPRTNTW